MPITDVEPDTVAKWLDEEETLLVDVREIKEHKVESIPAAQLHPLSTFNPKCLPKGTKRVVFTCAAGIRSTRAANIWLEENKGATAYNLKGGLQAWIKEGLPSYRNHHESTEIQKKGFRIGGALVLLFSGLAFLNSWFSIGGLVVGALFLFLGTKGYATLNWVLSKT